VPRPPRLQVRNGLYHVTARGNRRQDIFREDDDYSRFMTLADRVVRQLGWWCHGYCLMPNHYHLVVETPRADLSNGMHRLNSAYAHWFNHRHGLEGHLFQGRFHARLIDTEPHLLELSRYLALNPIRAGLCDRVYDWPWNSYRFVAHRLPAPALVSVERVLGCFGREPRTARDAFRAFVMAGL
jgi:putative transposase